MSESNLLERIKCLAQTDGKIEPHILRARKNYARSYMAWDDAEDQILTELIENNNSSLSYIARQLKRSPRAVEARMSVLDLVIKTSNPSITNNEVLHNNKNCSSQTATNEINQVLQYWRNSLADADKMGLSPKQMQRGEAFTLADFKNGQLSASKIQRFFDEAERAIKKKNSKHYRNKSPQKPEEITVNKLSVLIAPYTMAKNYLHAQEHNRKRSPKELFPLWLVADLTREGKLIPTEELSYPWIERRCLTPNEASLDGVGFPIIGDVTQVDEFYTHNLNLFSEENRTWQALFTYAQDLFYSLTEERSDSLNKQNFSLLEKGYLLPVKDIIEASKSLLTTYDQYISASAEKIPPILKNFCSLKDEQALEDLPIETIFMASLKHLAQAQSQYPLAATQRTSLSYFSTIEDNSIFTVHGPPGTGKTTLLLSVIVSQWVEAAIQKQFPPILVAASTNNLAVLNILDHFKKIGCSESNTASIRWLPDFDSYGLYLAPNHRVKEAEEKGYPYRQKSNFSSLDLLYEEEYRVQAKAYFLFRYNEYFQKNELELEPCQQFIHEQMLSKQALLHKTIHFSKEFYLIELKYSSLENLESIIAEQNSQQLSIEDKINRLKKIHMNWLLFKTTQLKWPIIFKWTSLGKSLLADRIKLFIAQYSEVFTTSINQLAEIENVLEDQLTKEESVLQQLNKTIKQLQLDKEKYLRFYEDKIHLEKQLGLQISAADIFDFNSPTNILCKLDQTLRYDLFILATHYWEVTWLLENKNLNSLKSNFADKRKFWQIQAMLTPCLVTTLHSGPGFFQYKTSSQSFETLANFIDLLIIDEAGQVMPAIAGAMVSIAKKVLLVGDTQQIEPIYTLTEGIDLANAKKYGLCKNEHDYENMKKMGILCSGDPKTTHAYGNLVILGQRKAPYHLKNHTVPGMLLTEHRRCAKEIISYCNELCYTNQLQPLTIEETSPYPRMGYAHIKGHEEKQGSSRFNKIEAETIVTWLLKNKQKILQTCAKEHMNECVGIITPYSAQSLIIQTLLQQHGLQLEKVGTIHSLQGAEKPIIIFSPVGSADEKQDAYFFDKSPNMLNVAVSRAKRSFLVFGDMDIFQPGKNKLPSSLLAKYLFAKEENEIVDIVQPKFNILKDQENTKIWQITTLKEHRNTLKRTFQRAEYELNIVSPFLRINAIEADHIPDLIAQCSSKITINIYTDPTLNQNKLPEFKQAKAVLEKAGATVYLVNNVHSKLITIDHEVIIEGSFNWLSAARSGDFIREECSIIYTGAKVVEFILKTLEPIKAKIHHPKHSPNTIN